MKSALIEPTCTWYWPRSTARGPLPSMSPTVTASRETGNETCTVGDAPAASSILAQPTSRCGGASTVLTG